jgi:hypothetical protein
LVNEAVNDKRSNIPNTTFENNLQQYLLKQLEGNTIKESCVVRRMTPDASNFGFYINGGLDRMKFESSHTEALKSMYYLYENQLEDEPKAYSLLYEVLSR